ncbi:Inner membrane protein [Salmonella enterica subsp. arizonae]|uniref:Inner membrane protein n=1 Tax=Salmonella enterica subsp. arizonae TaxID=59203 RepID=A0A379T623_SALER|nr:Inner membrane protein [Salmonella enterica subsp. arizonae]
MFESKINPLWQRLILAVQEEVKPALGCTEPIFTGAGGSGGSG